MIWRCDRYTTLREQVAEMEGKCAKLEESLAETKQKLANVQASEQVNSDGIMVNRHGESKASLKVKLVEARNLASMDYSGVSLSHS